VRCILQSHLQNHTTSLARGFVPTHRHGEQSWVTAGDHTCLRGAAIRHDVIVRVSVSKTINVGGVDDSRIVLQPVSTLHCIMSGTRTYVSDRVLVVPGEIFVSHCARHGLAY
jgi:hypothetical protein